jgi:SAM-dependent methyltransferase
MIVESDVVRSTEQQCVEAIIATQVDELSRRTSAKDVDRVVLSISRDIPVDYDADWRGFAVAYLLVNYRKALWTLRVLPARPWSRVTDIGSGTGAAALAYVTVAAERQTAPAAMTLLDRSSEQLGVARACVDEALAQLRMATSTRTEWTDLTDYVAREPQDVLLCSHVLSEQRPALIASVMKRLFVQLSPGGCLIAVERGDDEPWRRSEFPGLLYSEHHTGRVDALAPAHWSAEATERQWSTGWYAAMRPEHWMERLVAGYFDAWTQRDVNLLALVFGQEATYQEKPFEAALDGLQEIEAYWIEHVSRQLDIQITINRVSFGYLAASVEWSASFVEAGRVRVVTGAMVLDFDPVQRRISALREVFRTRDTPIS